MRLLLGWLLLIAVAAVLVQAETSYEVDDNGDEFEVKRFNIQGRQLNGGRSQCVVSRRRRSPPAPGYGASEDEDRDEDGERQADEALEVSLTTPPSGVDTVSSFGGDVDGGVQFLAVGEKLDEEEGDDTEDQHDAPAHQVVFQHVPVKNQNQIQAAHAAPDSAVVVHAESPPQVNPDTHAVFELLPVGGDESAGDDEYYYDYDVDDDGNRELHYEEDLSPVSTTAIWSTGDDFGATPPPTPVGTKRPKAGKGGNKVSKKGKKKPPRRHGAIANRKKPSNNRRKIIKTRRRRPIKNRQGSRRPAGVSAAQKKKKKKDKRQPSKKKTSTSVRRKPSRKTSASRKRKKGQKVSAQSASNKATKNRRTNANLANRNVRKKNRNNKDSVDQGVRTYTKTETLTQTGSANDNRDVNCIIIRRDPAPTTQRPFWNILGREAGAVRSSGQFGHRKRANLRFSA